MIVTRITISAEGKTCGINQGHWPHPKDRGDAWCPGRSGDGISIYRLADGVLVVDRDWTRQLYETKYLRSKGVQAIVMRSDGDPIYYEGTRRPCGCTEPHLPHITGQYSTVRWGELVRYCPGVSGDDFIIGEDRWQGSADWPDQSRFRIATP